MNNANIMQNAAALAMASTMSDAFPGGEARKLPQYISRQAWRQLRREHKSEIDRAHVLFRRSLKAMRPWLVPDMTGTELTFGLEASAPGWCVVAVKAMTAFAAKRDKMNIQHYDDINDLADVVADNRAANDAFSRTLEGLRI